MIPFAIPAVLALLGGGAYVAVKKREQNATMTPEEEMMYQKLLRAPEFHDSTILRQYAAQFKKRGLTAQADYLNKRAAMRDLPQEVKAQQRDIFKKAMASKNANAVLNVADGFERMGASSAAAELRNYANSLQIPKLDDVQQAPQQSAPASN